MVSASVSVGDDKNNHLTYLAGFKFWKFLCLLYDVGENVVFDQRPIRPLDSFFLLLIILLPPLLADSFVSGWMGESLRTRYYFQFN